MMRNNMLVTVVVTISQFLFLSSALAQVLDQESSQERAAKLQRLSQTLRWNDEESRLRYRAVAHDVTRQVATEIDEFIAADFKPGVQPDKVKAALDTLLVDFAGPAAGANTATRPRS